MQVALQVREPVEPQVVVQVPVEDWTQVKPLSGPLRQSSSAPLQNSAGGVQADSQWQSTQAWEPVESQVVVQVRGAAPSQSSPVSTVPLPHSGGGGESASASAGRSAGRSAGASASASAGRSLGRSLGRSAGASASGPASVVV